MRVIYRGKVYEFEGRMKVREVIRRVGLYPHSAILLRGKEILAEDEFVEPEDEVELINPLSGGEI